MNGVQQASRQDLARALAPRYAHASRLEKGQILDEFCAITGLTRKHTLVLLGNPPAEHPVSNRRGRPPRYGPAEVALSYAYAGPPWTASARNDWRRFCLSCWTDCVGATRCASSPSQSRRVSRSCNRISSRQCRMSSAARSHRSARFRRC